MPDYYEYHNQLVADRISELGAEIKRLTERRSLVLYFYGYQRELIGNGSRHGSGHGGHLALRRLLESPDVDIICSPVSYFDRQPGGPSNIMSIVDSVTLAGKIFLQEDDSRTHLWKNAEPNLYYPTEWDSLQCLRRNFGNVLARNMAIWWMDLCANGNYNSPAIWRNNARLLEVCRDTVERQIPYRPEVALLYDEESFFWLKADSYDLTAPNGYLQRSAFQSMGATVGEYFVNDADRLPESVRMVVLVNTFRLTQEERRAIERLKSKGRTLVWLYAPGYVDERGLSVEAMEKLTGMRLVRNEHAIAPTVRLAEDSVLTGGLAAMRFGPEAPLAPTFAGAPDDPTSLVLGRYLATNQPALLMKKLPGWTSVFCGSPALSTPILRGLAREAGVTLLVNPEDVMTEDAVTFNGRYLFAYARRKSGWRQFVLPGESLADGGFERSGPMKSATAAGGTDSPGPFHSGRGAWQSGLIQGRAAWRQVLTEIPLAASGKGEWLCSSWFYLDRLRTQAAAPGDFIALTVEPASGGQPLATLWIAQGQKVKGDDQRWFRIEEKCRIGAAGSGNIPLVLRLTVRGNYQASRIVLDDLSFRRAGTPLRDVQDVFNGEMLARGVTAWGVDLKENEQRVFKLTPTP